MSSSSPHRDAVRIGTGILLAVIGCALVFWHAQIASSIEWECVISTCGTDDLRSVLPWLGAGCVIGACALLARLPRNVGQAIPLLALSATAVVGQLTSDGRDGTFFPVTVTVVIAIGAGLVGLLFLAASLRTRRRSRS